MVAFPEVQHRAKAELDAVVGRARLPTFVDAPRLPYVRAVIKRSASLVARRRARNLNASQDSTAGDDQYESMFIPKGAAYMANIRHCNHDRAIFGDGADDFKPERHLDVEREEVL
jgi:cytochrome P450